MKRQKTDALNYPEHNTEKGAVTMSRTLTREFSDRLMETLIRMEMPRETCLEVCTAIETTEELRLFLDKLSKKNYEMTPEEVYRAMVEAIEELQ